MPDKYIIWGAGKHCQSLLLSYNIPLNSIECFVDNNKSRNGEKILGFDVLSSEQLDPAIMYNFIVGSAKYYGEICENINQMFRNAHIELIDIWVQKFSKPSEVTSKFSRRGEYENFLSLIKRCGTICMDQLSDARVISSRESVLELLPKGGIACEVGVAYGDFSNIIIREIQPDFFVAIDYFSQDNPYRDFFGLTHFKDSGLSHREWYEKRFKKLIDDRKMEIKQGLSWDCLAEYKDNFFDYIYLDAGHDYLSVKKDISELIKKIKPGGIVQFNDYTLWDIDSEMYYGVVPAVNELLNQTGSKVLFLCLEERGFFDLVVKINK